LDKGKSKQALDKDKSKQAGGTGKAYSHGLSNTESIFGKPVSSFRPSEPIFSPVEPIFNFNIPKTAVNSLQSQPSNQKTQTLEKPISFSSPQ
jgi:hypothetical protein